MVCNELVNQGWHLNIMCTCVCLCVYLSACACAYVYVVCVCAHCLMSIDVMLKGVLVMLTLNESDNKGEHPNIVYVAVCVAV